jgi:UDP:flavonoid glycosyltransferase YjiC (YdhE family)
VTGLGTGFELPPASGALPHLLPHGAAPPARLAAAERRLCESANTALQALGAPPLQRASELFAAQRALLCTFAQTDPFQDLRTADDAAYFGPRLAWSTAHAPAWPDGSGRRIFVYLKGRYRETPAVLAALRALGHSVIGYVPGLPAADAARSASPRLMLSAQPVSLRQVARACDLVICNAGHGTCGGALLMGRPLLLIPAQVEQACNARVLRQHGLAHVIEPSAARPDLRAALSAALDDCALRERCAGFAAAHADFSEQCQIDALARAIAS